MKAELVKRQDRWDLYGEDGSKIASSAPNPFKRLSIKNCEAIENGYDLDELAENTYREYPTDLKDATYHYNRDYQVHKKRKAFIKGFQKAVEILGDKKFSEKDMRKAIAFGWDYEGRPKKEMLEIYNVNLEYNNSYSEDTQKYIQSLQQTEFDVEIEWEKDTELFNVCPKLDDNGCLILKRII